MTLDDLEPAVLGVNISQTVRIAIARLPLRQLGFLVLTDLEDLGHASY